MDEDKKIIFPNDKEAASLQTVEGWVSRQGRFYGVDERSARYDGSTHARCKVCGAVYLKNAYCVSCHRKRRLEKFEKMEVIQWDGETPLVIFDDDTYFYDYDDIEEYCDLNDVEPESLNLVLCLPNFASLDTDRFDDILPEDYVPTELEDAIGEFNEAMSGIVVSWHPGNKRVKLGENK